MNQIYAKRAALICRVSTTSQDNVRQVSELTELAQRMGFLVEPDDIFEDTISGFSKLEQRPALNRLRDHIKKGTRKYHMVFTMEISRLSRSPEQGQKLLADFSEHGIPVYVKNIAQCTHQDDGKRNPFFNIIFTLLSEFAHTEAEYIRERSISGMRSKKRNDTHAGGGIYQAYGFTKNDNKQLVIDEEEAAVVRDIFDYAARGYGSDTICKILNEAGIKTKSPKVLKKGLIVTKGNGGVENVKQTKHMRWVSGTLQSLLSNTIYIGQRKMKVGVDEKGKDMHEIVNVPAIISEELFNKVNKLRREKFDTRSVEKRYLFLLKSICHCGVCSRTMSGRYKPGPNGIPTDNYYQCLSKRYAHTNCGNISPNIEALESIVWDLVKNSHQMFEHLKSTGTKLKEANDKMDLLMDELRFQEKNLVNLEKEKSRLKNLYLKEVLSDDEFDLEWKKMEKQVSNSKNNINRLNKQKVALAETRVLLSNMDSYVEVLANIQNDRFQAATVLNNIVQKVIVTSVDRHRNNNRFILSVFIKDMLPPLSVMMITKQRNQHNKHFILDSISKLAGQNRFKYIEFTNPELLQYNEQGILITPMEEVEEMIQVQERPFYYTSKLQQHNYLGNLCRSDESFGDDEEYQTVLECVPKLLPFEEKNYSSEVMQIKEQQRVRKID